jgi:beta-N-acetylhexosaminidase
MADIAADAGQVLWIGFAGPDPDDELRRTVAAGGCGAVVVFARNLVTRGGVTEVDALIALNDAVHGAAPPGAPVLIAVDQEGGTVQRVRAPATRWPPMLSLDRLPSDEDEAVAERLGAALGAELAAVGFDVDFAPVLDVHTRDTNPVIGERAFGRDPVAVARRGVAFTRGLTAAGVLACGKHFPGHGDTTADSHLELPVVDHPVERLEEVELVPFVRAVAAGIPMLMTAHVVYRALDPDLPATLSRAVVGDHLRRRLGYRGVIVSDDLDMKAIVDHFGIADAAILALAAGCDALLLCRDEGHQREAREAVIRRAESDTALRARLGEAAARVRALKAARPTPVRDRSVIGCAAHQALAARLAALLHD